MLESLIIENLGPAPRIPFEFAERLNLITGDNGLGKTFTLDLAWYALTRTWPRGEGKMILPNPRQKWGTPKLTYHVHGIDGPNKEVVCTFDASSQSWKRPPGRPPIPGLVVYARLDGGFAVWDPSRNYWRDDEERTGRERPPLYRFTKEEVWDGLKLGDQTICNGLIADVDKWRLTGNGPYQLLQETLVALSPQGQPPLRITGAARVAVDDVRDVPTLDLGYGEVPITQASAGMTRVLSLAYLLVWAWTEHAHAAEFRQEQPTGQIILLFDEVEAHLHPQWQRVFLPALKGFLETRLAGRDMRVQVIATTHAPLVFASVEAIFDEEKDSVFTFDVENGAVALRTMDWSLRGDASAWLRSPFFNETPARSPEAEIALDAAKKWMRGDHTDLPAGLGTREEIDARLHQVLPEFDRFLPRWIAQGERGA